MKTQFMESKDDISCMSELAPPSCFRKKAGGVIRTYHLASLSDVLIK